MTYVWVAYTLIWLAIFGYSLMLNSRQKKLEREIMLLKQAIDDHK